jgi:hypothetical protein
MKKHRLKRIEGTIATKRGRKQIRLALYLPDRRAYSLDKELLEELDLDPNDFDNLEEIPEDLINKEDLDGENIIVVNIIK